MSKTDIVIATTACCAGHIALRLGIGEAIELWFLAGAICLGLALIVLDFIFERQGWKKK